MLTLNIYFNKTHINNKNTELIQNFHFVSTGNFC